MPVYTYMTYKEKVKEEKTLSFSVQEFPVLRETPKKSGLH